MPNRNLTTAFTKPCPQCGAKPGEPCNMDCTEERAQMPVVPERPVLHYSDRGPSVVALRRMLSDLGFDVMPDFFDGELNSALQVFQRNHGLKCDGICGRATWAALDKALAAKGGQP